MVARANQPAGRIIPEKVPSPSPHALLIIIAALGLACRRVGPGGADGGEEVAPAPLPLVEAGASACPDLTLRVPLDYKVADVLILFDRSGSMITEFGAGTRYSVEAALLSDVITAYQDKLRFGFQQFPSRDMPGCEGHALGCCADPPSVGVALGQAKAIAAAVSAAAPVGGSTPTAEALKLAREYFTDLDDGVADRYLLLSTDGQPSCGANGRLAEDDVYDVNGNLVAGACHDAVAEVEALRELGVTVIVLGVGPGLQNDPGRVPSCLEELARKGGWPRPDGQTWFFSGTEPVRLETALQQIFGGLTRPSCDRDLEQLPPDPDRVEVFFDGHQVPRSNQQGWDFTPPSNTRHIRIFGEYCHRLQRFQVSTVDIRLGCPPCTEKSCVERIP
jgi:hypothetical protein